MRHDELARAEREDDDEELRQVAERRLEDARDGGAELRSHRLGRDPDRPGAAAEGDSREDEDGDRRCVGVVEDAGDDDEGEDGGRDDRGPSHRRTKPIVSYIRASVGVDAACAFSAP